MSESTVARLKRAVHRNRTASRDGALERLFTWWFKGLVYTQIWEDPRVDAAALQLDETSRVLTISSAGCNVLNYLIRAPERVVAVDLNAAHMALTRLKLTALKHLPDHETFFRFFGAADDPANLDAYRRHVQPHLRPKTRAFWEQGRGPLGLGRSRIHHFADGLYDRGKTGLFQRLVHSLSELMVDRDLDALLDAETQAEQEAFFDEVVAPFFDHPVVRRLTQLPAVVYSLGIPPSQHAIMEAELQATEADTLADLYRERLRRLVCDFPIQDNYFAWQLFGRRYDTERRRAVPPYLKPGHYARIRYHLDRVDTREAALDDVLQRQPDASFDSFVLLDAQDWMTPDAITQLWRKIRRVGAPGARIIFRTAGADSPVERALPPSLRCHFTYERNRSEALYAQDRSAVYGMFHCYVLSG
jgi:S-adenosylmethionine-diacylglycerol 3-amino-3-carboxypropyl transferase